MSNLVLSKDGGTSREVMIPSTLGALEREIIAATHSDFDTEEDFSYDSSSEEGSSQESSQEEKYKYEPFSDSNCIRLLVLEPGEGHNRLKGHLKITTLSEAHRSFQAISYAWGRGRKRRTMTVDDRSMAITTSLEGALCQARLPDKPRTVWADAICINQDDDQEKGLQVRLMGRIFEMSRCTLICLGSGCSTEAWPDEVEGLIRDVNQMMDRVFADPSFNWDWNEFPHPEPSDSIISDERWKSWNELMRQPWFKRGWVVQEAALGLNCLVLLAGRTIPWLSVLRVNGWLEWRSSQLIGLGSVVFGLSLLHGQTYAHRLPKEYRTFVVHPKEGTTSPYMEITALEVLDLARALDLKDPKDRIYAFMDYPSSDAAMPALQPKYENDTPYLDVYKEFTIEYLEKNNDLGILHFVEHEEGDEVAAAVGVDPALGQAHPPSFPSWIPRWDRGAKVVKIVETDHRKFEQSSQEIALLDNDRSLRVKGVSFDTVQYVSDKIQYITEPEEAVASVVSLWRDVAHQSIKHPGPHQSRLSLAFLCCLCRGVYNGDFQAWVRARSAFADLLEDDRPDIPLDTYTKSREAQYISRGASLLSRNRRFVVLGRGYFGLSSVATRKGDLCAIIFGTHSPFMLRQVAGKKDHYFIIGATYVESAEVDTNGISYRMGQYEECDDWKDWNLPIRDMFLC